MELLKDKDTRIGDLPVELRNILSKYITSPKIAIIPDIDEYTDYKIMIEYPDKSITILNVMFRESTCIYVLAEIVKPIFVVKIREIEGDVMSQDLYLNSNNSITTHQSSLSISLHDETFIIFKQKLREFFSDFINYRKDPVNYKMKKEY